MNEIRYSRGKFWLAAIFFGHVAAFMLVLLFHPNYHVPSRYGLLFNGTFGHFFTVPIIVLACSLVAVRSVMIATGSGVAIVTDDQGVRINSIWRSYRLAWNDLLRVRVAATKVRRTTSWSLKFDRCNGSTISLPLNGLRIPVNQGEYERLAQRLSETHLAAIKSPAANCSADAISRGEGGVQPEVPTQPRPVFGRKVA